MRLKEFLNSDDTTTRENIFKHKFLYDVSLAAAKRGYSLGIYRSEMDLEGFDVILNDKDNVKHLQLKTIIGKTASWPIHRSILRPSMFIAEKLEGAATHGTVGIEGGIVLQEIILKNGNVKVDYYFTDYFILRLLYKKIILRNASTYKALIRVFTEIRQGSGNSKITLTKSMFVKTKSPDSLLTLCGLHSNIGNKAWINNLISLEQRPQKVQSGVLLNAPLAVYKNCLIDDINLLCYDKFCRRE